MTENIGMGKAPQHSGGFIECVLDLSSDLPESDVWLVVDLFRATTTLASFFEHGGKCCRLAEEVEEALLLKKVLGPGWILAGERNALPPEGFDLGNSPRAFLSLDPGKWEGLILTTSNGTRGLLRASRQGGTVFAACAQNAGAAAGKANASGERITILCCGQKGKPALEDTLCAGLLVERLLSESDMRLPGKGARKALAAWVNSGRTLEAAKASEHARRLVELGFSEDLDFCCQVDGLRAVPRVASPQGLMFS
jgi:2-phosphosulfolactate phosphatase